MLWRLHTDRFLLQVTGHRSQVTGHRSEVTGHRPQVTGRRSHVAGHRSRVTGCRTHQIQKAISITGDVRITRDSQEICRYFHVTNVSPYNFNEKFQTSQYFKLMYLFKRGTQELHGHCCKFQDHLHG